MSRIKLCKIRNTYEADTSPIGSATRHIPSNYLFCKTKDRGLFAFGDLFVGFIIWGFFDGKIIYLLPGQRVYSKLFAMVLKVIKTVRQRCFLA